jgi:filamentous hemagglutinin family protein
MILKLSLSQKINIFLISILSILIFHPRQSISQSIIPAQDNIQTTVNSPDNHQFNIQGGQRSGVNLFHSFERFGLNNGQTANFISQPDIQNIIGRINGGEASIINGLIQVSGGLSNLYLINPAGIILGENAQLNIPASVIITTANSLEFGNNQWFNITGEPNLSSLMGSPMGFRFDSNTPGAIINLGQLQVNSGYDLMLVGGTVVNTGTLSAPNGNLIIETVEGENLVRISQAGNILNLEIKPESNTTINPLSLPELLTKIETDEATQVTINSEGNVVLSNGELIQSGDIVVTASNSQNNHLSGNNIILNASNNLILLSSQLIAIEELNLLAENTIKIRDNFADNFTAISNGNLTMTAVNNIDILTRYSVEPFQVEGDVTLISNGIISADSQFQVGGNLNLQNINGEPANFISLFDPIIYANGDVIFGEYTGASLKIEARGNIIGSDITITNPDQFLVEVNDPDANILRSQPSLILRAGVNSLSNSPNIDSTNSVGNTVFIEDTISGNSISVGAISTAGGVTILESPGEITIDQINTQGGDIQLRSNNNITIGQGLNSTGGNIEIITESFLQINGTLNNSNASISTRGIGENGDIFIQHQGGETTPFIVGEGSINGTVGSITTGIETLFPFLEIPVPEDGIFTQGNITIQTTPPPLPPSIEPEVPEELIELESEIRTALETEPLRQEENIILSDQPLENEEILSVDPTINYSETNNITEEIDSLTVQENDVGSLAIVRQDIDSQTIINDLRTEVITLLDNNLVEAAVPKIEQILNFQLANYLGKDYSTFDRDIQIDNIRGVLKQVEQQFNQKAAVIYTFSRPNQLDLILVTANGRTLYKTVPGANQADLRNQVIQFALEIKNPVNRSSNEYLTLSQKLYEWLISPLKQELQNQEIDAILFAMDEGLKSLPIAALYDGEQFLIEQYSYSLIPSFSLINLRYHPLQNSQILAMGASQFEEQAPLPAVPIEVKTITSTFPGDHFINDSFTLNNYKEQRDQAPYRIVHFATHADFRPGFPEDSYIQLWNQKLTLNRLNQLGWKWNDPPTDLFVLSACRTAIGDKNAELGFAGLAVQAGVPSALASLWYVSDRGTLALMLKFYEKLQQIPIKAEALRQTQIALLRGEIQIQAGELRGYTSRGNIELPPDLYQDDTTFSHPFYWAGFTMIGSPW